MAQKTTDQYLTDRQEKALLNAIAAAVRTSFPNPEHRGCPQPSVVRNLARRRIPLQETGDLVDHIATCSTCFDAYSRYRRRYRAARATRPIIAAAICLLALALVWSHRVPRSSTPHQGPAFVPFAPVLRATIDYREASPTRSSEAPGQHEIAAHAQKALIDLTIVLPFGTEDGAYSLELRDATGKPVTQATGTAGWNGTAEALTARVDFRQPVGEYTLALRKAGESWHTYRLILEDSK